MLKWAGNVLLIIALFAATDAQWLALQSVAWIGMVMNYSEQVPLKTALAKTFDGQHPCPLCRAIAAGQKSEKKNEFTLQLIKLEFPPAPENFLLVAPDSFRLLPMASTFAESRLQEPLTPPPRNRFA